MLVATAAIAFCEGVMRFLIRAIPLNEFQLVEGRYIAEAMAIFAKAYGYDDHTMVQWKRADPNDDLEGLTANEVFGESIEP